MTIQHVSLCTTDLERMIAFYRKYFGAIEHSVYHNPKTGMRSCFLEFDKGAKLEVMTRSSFTLKPSDHTVGYVHIAMDASSPAGVDFTVARLKHDGYTIVSEPRVDGQGYYESTVQDPDGNWLEITGGKAK